MFRKKLFQDIIIVALIPIIVMIVLVFSCFAEDAINNEIVGDDIIIAETIYASEDDGTVISSSVYNYPESIMIGEYQFTQQQLVDMSSQELEDFILLVRVVNCGLWFSEIIVDKLCRKYLPNRFLIIE